MKKIIALTVMLMFLPAISANLIVTEVMHTPNQTAHQSTAEWFEVYNTGNEYLDLGEWSLEGRSFEEVFLPPKTYLVVARKLIDLEDPTADSFECWWEDCNGIWDEGYLAVEGSFVLTTSDTITLEGPNYTFILEYDNWYGHNNDGKSMILINYSCPQNKECWEEGIYGGLPGRGKTKDNEIIIIVEIANVAPEIIDATILTDDSNEQGIQIMPEYDKPKKVKLEAKVKDANGNNDIENVTAEINGRTYNLNLNNTEKYDLYVGEIEMLPEDKAGIYNVTIKAFDGIEYGQKNLTLKYEQIIATILETSELNFGILKPGQESEPKEIIIKNTGNADVEVKLEMEKLNSINGTLVQGNFYVSKDEINWQNILYMKNFEVNPGKQGIFKVKLNLPEKVEKNILEGRLRVLSLGK